MGLLTTLSTRIERCKEEVDNRNRNNLILFSEGAFLISIVMIGVSLALPYYHWMTLPHVILFCYTGMMYFLGKYCQRNKVTYIRALQYLLFTPILLGGVLVSSAMDPTSQGITIILFICILPLFMIDNPWRMIVFQLFFAGLFVICSAHFKPTKIFMSDMLYLPIYMAYIVGVNLFVLLKKISGVENYLLVCKSAERDTLTELYNRASGEMKVRQLLQKNIPGTFAILDIDDFKSFNDKYGHQFGDKVLREVSSAMHTVFRSEDVLWRLGGDEFAIYAINLTDPEICRQRFSELLQVLKAIKFSPDNAIRISVSIGCTIYKGEKTEFSHLYQVSDEAMYESKNNGKGQLILKCI